MTPQDHRVWMSTFIRLHPTVFATGDIFEAVPDEPEGGTYWYKIYGSRGVGENDQAKQEFNDFIQGSIIDANNVFHEMGVVGVSTAYVFTNPSAARDIISDTTAGLLAAMGTDDYPENTCLSASECESAMKQELSNWIVPSHTGKAKHITIGPSVYNQFSQTTQANTYSKYFPLIKSMIAIEGITIWQGGANDNPKSRLFDYSNGTFVPRKATQIINYAFSQ